LDLNEFKKELKSLKKIQGVEALPKSVGGRLNGAVLANPTFQIPPRQGIDISSYCEQNHSSKSEIWQKVRRGELLAKHSGGMLWIIDPSLPTEPELEFDESAIESDHKTLPSGSTNSTKSEGSVGFDSGLPPIPSGTAQNESSSGNPRESVELALLIDHLSLAKDENREILKMAQESLERISSMAERVVSTKEQLIKEKEVRLNEQSDMLSTQREQIELLKVRLQSQEQDMLKLRREVENLEILSRSLTDVSND
jgi:hypothetical protein